MIRQEHELTIREILAITGGTELLSSNTSLARTLTIRDTYLLPLHSLQISLLKRLRASNAFEAPESSESSDSSTTVEAAGTDPTLRRALSVTINGIATGLRNTG